MWWVGMGDMMRIALGAGARMCVRVGLRQRRSGWGYEVRTGILFNVQGVYVSLRGK